VSERGNVRGRVLLRVVEQRRTPASLAKEEDVGVPASAEERGAGRCAGDDRIRRPRRPENEQFCAGEELADRQAVIGGRRSEDPEQPLNRLGGCRRPLIEAQLGPDALHDEIGECAARIDS
jgi:hypothetical protein